MVERVRDTPDTWAKPLRSYRLRGRRLTPAQQAAFDTLDRWAFPVVEAAAPVAAIATHRGVDTAAASFVDLVELFGNERPDGERRNGERRDGELDGVQPDGLVRRRVAMEIGFGMAETTLAMAIAQPEVDLIAVDVHRPGVAALLKGIDDHGLTNVRVARGDAVEILSRQIAPGALDEVRVFFPDPWPKAQHHRRRLVDAEFVALVAGRLRPGGRVHLATDWEHYARQMRALIDAEPTLANQSSAADGFVERPAHRPVTRFERIGLDKGHDVFDLIATRRP